MSAETIVASLVRESMAEVVVHGAYLPALIVHASAGAIGLVSGAAALFLRKGEFLHRLAGRGFAAAMLILGLSAVPIAETHASVITGPLAAYFAATAWLGARGKGGTSGLFAICAPAFALGLSATYFIFGAQAAISPTGKLDGFPASFHYVFGSIAGLAALLDLNAILRRNLSEAARIARHLWRMCLALFSAATSFFLGQIDRFSRAHSRHGLQRRCRVYATGADALLARPRAVHEALRSARLRSVPGPHRRRLVPDRDRGRSVRPTAPARIASIGPPASRRRMTGRSSNHE